jgi:antitoxin component of RelBE/YafQ-DinJ toxin-antitoxin module
MKINRKDGILKIREQQAFLDRIKQASDKLGITPTDFIRMLIRKGLNHYERNIIPSLNKQVKPTLELSTSNIEIDEQEMQELAKQMEMFK